MYRESKERTTTTVSSWTLCTGPRKASSEASRAHVSRTSGSWMRRPRQFSRPLEVPKQLTQMPKAPLLGGRVCHPHRNREPRPPLRLLLSCPLPPYLLRRWPTTRRRPHRAALLHSFWGGTTFLAGLGLPRALGWRLLFAMGPTLRAAAILRAARAGPALSICMAVGGPIGPGCSQDH